jgi:hypothetical protein
VKGIVFNLLEQVVTAAHGEDVWDQLLDDAGVDGAYTSLGNYPDAELGLLVTAASQRLETPPDDVVRWFGEQTLPLFFERYPELFSAQTSTRALVLNLNEVIHPEVNKLYPGASTPIFAFDTSSPDTLLMEYRSSRQLCSFAEGLLLGTAAHYGESIAIDQPRCMKHGHDHCVLAISHPT